MSDNIPNPETDEQEVKQDVDITELAKETEKMRVMLDELVEQYEFDPKKHPEDFNDVLTTLMLLLDNVNLIFNSAKHYGDEVRIQHEHIKKEQVKFTDDLEKFSTSDKWFALYQEIKILTEKIAFSLKSIEQTTNKNMELMKVGFENRLDILMMKQNEYLEELKEGRKERKEIYKNLDDTRKEHGEMLVSLRKEQSERDNKVLITAVKLFGYFMGAISLSLLLYFGIPIIA